MHSLNLKVISSFNSLSLRSRISDGVKDNTLRFNRIVACSTSPSSGSSHGSLFSRAEKICSAEAQLEVAAKSEDFKEAARLRDSLKPFEEEEPVLRLQRMLRESIAKERFADAARYHDELKEIAPHCLLKCTSDATTLGIRVQVRSVYIEGRSRPLRGLYFLHIGSESQTTQTTLYNFLEGTGSSPTPMRKLRMFR